MTGSDGLIGRVVSLRLAVGTLGERDNAGWWTSGFMSPTSSAFLTPIFGPKVLQARYEGVVQAARRVHDERIGVGRAFHPFRLPEAAEQRISDFVQAAGQELTHVVSSTDAARAALDGLAGGEVEARSGPALVAGADVLEAPEWVSEVASLYSAALRAGGQCFPYFSSR
ncbi:BrxE family protein [Roseomonas sp. SSH11]|uniref:BrxE family protein n=1 Tax=Pararoseomonas baculiformis TaxID=2820812 RepID=A0ABS4AMK3_9PROT|nr:BrxE family protein [Pararoseomonas baculiformis]MBP0447758.1 BrxE family protein [Pararoseomonas baculiformis]